jgi:hypothetical protein
MTGLALIKRSFCYLLVLTQSESIEYEEQEVSKASCKTFSYMICAAFIVVIYEEFIASINNKDRRNMSID